jgi:pimeloyl-ACP methyl ester carboxylesterase
VRLARRLAERGVASIRFDLAGHGDSARLTGEHSFEEQAVVDIRAAMDALTSAAGTTRAAIFGICSGAYHGYAAALRDDRVIGLMMFDAYKYPNIKTHIIHYAKALSEPEFVPRVSGALGRGAAGLVSRARSAVRRPARSRVDESPHPRPTNLIPTRAEFAAGLTRLLDRGVCVHMLYSGDAPEEYNYANQFHDTVAPFGIGDRIEAEFLPQADHQFSVMADQVDIIRRITDWVDELSRGRETDGPRRGAWNRRVRLRGAGRDGAGRPQVEARGHVRTAADATDARPIA